jgi:site-specific recombinase XerD
MRSKCIALRSPLAEPIRHFVAHKRALKRRYHTEERALSLLDRYLTEHGVTKLSEITPTVLEAFMISRPRARPRSYNHLLGVVRCLFNWMVEQEFLGDSPFRLRPRRASNGWRPYLFDLAHAGRLIKVAAALPDRNKAPLRGPTYAMIFALLYGLGLRVGEVTRLTRADIDLAQHLLVIRETKFAKSRLVPFGPQMAARLKAYLDLKEQQSVALKPADAAFSFTQGRAIHPGTISQTFHALVPRLGLILPPGVAPPRAHDLRHSFAVSTLLRWYRDGLDPTARLLHLSTFLGHVDPASTAVYLTITIELMDAAGQRFEHFAGPLSTGAES